MPTWSELAIGLASLLLVANAARRGFLREGSLLLGLGLALGLAGPLYRQAELGLPREASRGAWAVALYVALALALLLGAAALSALVTPAVRRGPLRTLDRLVGAGIGLAEATVVVGLAAILGQRVGLWPAQAVGPTARAVDAALLAIGWLTASIPAEVVALAR